MATLSRIATIAAFRRAVPAFRRARLSMGVIVLSFSPSNRWGVCLFLTAALTGCATPSFTKVATTQSLPAQSVPDTKRAVQSIRQESTSVDGQTSWIIEPDVPRIPKIAGLDAQLPPHIERQLSRAFDLAQRDATYSANAEFRSVLGLCALELDALDGGTRHREALRQGLIALDEADELAGDNIDWRDAADVRHAAESHVTPVLHGNTQPAVDSIQAVQAYYAFAEDRFAFACEGSPGASLALYGLARTFVVPGTHFTHAAGKSALLQRVALRVAPQNVLAGNELGVLLAQHGHLDEAEGVFRQCVATNASPETWRNLAVVYARQGDEDASRAALAAGAALASDSRKSAIEYPSPNANSATQISIAKSGSTVTTHNGHEDATKSSDVEQPPSYWAKLDLASKLPNVFRR